MTVSTLSLYSLCFVFKMVYTQFRNWHRNATAKQHSQRSLREERIRNLERIQGVLEELTQSVSSLKREKINFIRIKQELKSNEALLVELDQMITTMQSKQVHILCGGEVVP